MNGLTGGISTLSVPSITCKILIRMPDTPNTYKVQWPSAAEEESTLKVLTPTFNLLEVWSSPFSIDSEALAPRARRWPRLHLTPHSHRAHKFDVKSSWHSADNENNCCQTVWPNSNLTQQQKQQTENFPFLHHHAPPLHILCWRKCSTLHVRLSNSFYCVVKNLENTQPQKRQSWKMMHSTNCTSVTCPPDKNELCRCRVLYVAIYSGRLAAARSFIR